MKFFARLLTYFSISTMLFVVGCWTPPDQIHTPNNFESFDQNEFCEVLNSNLDALQAILEAQVDAAYAVSVTPIEENKAAVGYAVSLSNKRNFKIYTSTTNKSPIIHIIKQDDAYYWCYNFNVLSDNGKKFEASTTKLKTKIEKDTLYVSGNNGPYKKLGYVTGVENIRFFRSVEQGDKRTTYQLANGLLLNLRQYAADEIRFADNYVEMICEKKWDSNGDGYLSYSEAEAVEDISNTFMRNINITSFNELQYFTKLQEIPDSSFYASYALKEVAFSDNITSIGEYAFANCTDLKRVNWGSNLSTIGYYAFRNCGFESVKIPESCYTIGDCAFYYCEELENVEIGSNVEYIGYYAFLKSKVRSVTIPESVKTIHTNPWAYCDSLASFKGKFASADGRLIICNNTIVSSAMAGLESYTVPEGPTTIGTIAFSEASMTKIVLPQSLTAIGHNVFRDCKELTEVRIPAGIRSIGYGAFNGCEVLEKVYCAATTPPILEDDVTFSKNSPARVIYVPAESVDAYKADASWSKYASAIKGYDF